METLKEQILKSAIKKSKQFEIWEKEVDNNEVGTETESLANAREYLSRHEYDFLDELICLGYIKVLDEFENTYTLGDNRDDIFLLEIAYTFTADCGYITKKENDYYEVGKQQGLIAKAFLKNNDKF